MITWRTLWFGSETPRRRQVIVTLSALLLVALIGLGAFVDFIPAEWLRHRGRIEHMFGFIGLCLTILLYGALIIRGHMARQSFRENLKLWAAFPFAPFFLGWVCWLVLAKALPWSFTRFFGDDRSIQATMWTAHMSSRRSCDYRLTGGPFADTMPAYLCVGSRVYDAYPDREVQVRLIGKASPLGFAVVSGFVGPPLQESTHANESARE